MVCVWISEDDSQEPSLFPSCGAQDRTQEVRPSGLCYYLLSLLARLPNPTFYLEIDCAICSQARMLDGKMEMHTGLVDFDRNQSVDGHLSES